MLLGIGSDAEVTQQTCTGGGPYMDIAAGAQVTVTNASGSVVGAGTLGTGHWGTGNDDPNSCRFTYAVKVSKGSAFYGVQIAQRPKMTVSAQSAESKVLGQSLEGL